MNDNEPMYQITASIVLYNNDDTMLQNAIQSFLASSLNIHILLVDNSPTDKLRYLSADDRRITYLFNNANVGFGAAHNIAFRQIANHSKYHVIINPDVYFDQSILEKMYDYMEGHHEIGILSPKVYYPDGSLQYLCRKLPAPVDIIIKRLVPSVLRPLFKRRIDAYEFRDRNYEEIMNVPSLSGCFMFVRSDVFKNVGGFDENFFMYMEDFDFTRRVLENYKTVYYPYAIIFHHYARESATSKKLLYIAIKSTIYYFNKWGWFYDKGRKQFNNYI